MRCLVFDCQLARYDGCRPCVYRRTAGVYVLGRVGYWLRDVEVWIATCLRKPLASALNGSSVGSIAHSVASLFLFLDWVVRNINEHMIVLGLVVES